MRSVDENFYKSSAWLSTRSAYISKVNGLCERCLNKGLIVPGKIVHHKIHLTRENYLDPEVSLNFDNLELLCQRCHNEEHFGAKEPKRYRFSDDGSMLF